VILHLTWVVNTLCQTYAEIDAFTAITFDSQDPVITNNVLAVPEQDLNDFSYCYFCIDGATNKAGLESRSSKTKELYDFAIYDLNGQLLNSGKALNEGNFIEGNINLPEGIYIIRKSVGNSVETKKYFHSGLRR